MGDYEVLIEKTLYVLILWLWCGHSVNEWFGFAWSDAAERWCPFRLGWYLTNTGMLVRVRPRCGRMLCSALATVLSVYIIMDNYLPAYTGLKCEERRNREKCLIHSDGLLDM